MLVNQFRSRLEYYKLLPSASRCANSTELSLEPRTIKPYCPPLHTNYGTDGKRIGLVHPAQMTRYGKDGKTLTRWQYIKREKEKLFKKNRKKQVSAAQQLAQNVGLRLEPSLGLSPELDGDIKPLSPSFSAAMLELSERLKELHRKRAFLQMQQEWAAACRQHTGVTRHAILLTQLLQSFEDDPDRAIKVYEILHEFQKTNVINYISVVTHRIMLNILAKNERYDAAFDLFNHVSGSDVGDGHIMGAMAASAIPLFLDSPLESHRECALALYSQHYQLLNVTEFAHCTTKILNTWDDFDDCFLWPQQFLEELTTYSLSRELHYVAKLLSIQALKMEKFNIIKSRKFDQNLMVPKDEEELINIIQKIRQHTSLAVEAEMIDCLVNKEYSKGASYFLENKVLCIKDNLVIFHMIVVRLAREDFNAASEVFCRAVEQEAKPWTSTYNYMISEFGKRSWVDMALHLFEDIHNEGRDTTATYNSLLRMYQRMGKFAKSLYYYDLMKRKGLVPDQFTYAPLVEIAMRTNNIAQLDYYVEEIFRIAWRSKFIMSMCLRRLYSAFGKLHENDRAEHLFQQMVRAGLPISPGMTYSRYKIRERVISEKKQVELKEKMEEEFERTAWLGQDQSNMSPELNSILMQNYLRSSQVPGSIE